MDVTKWIDYTYENLRKNIYNWAASYARFFRENASFRYIGISIHLCINYVKKQIISKTITEVLILNYKKI